MVIKFDRAKRQPRPGRPSKSDTCGLVIDLTLRRVRSSGQDDPPVRRLPGSDLRRPLLPGEQACVPAIERYVLGVREIAVKESLKIAKKGRLHRLKTAPED